MNGVNSATSGKSSPGQGDFTIGEDFGGEDGFWDSKIGNGVDEKENQQIIEHLGIGNFSKEMQEEILGMMSDMMVNSNKGMKGQADVKKANHETLQEVMKALGGKKLGEMPEEAAADLIADKLGGIKTSAERLDEKGVEYEVDDSGAQDKTGENPKDAPLKSDAEKIKQLLQNNSFQNGMANLIQEAINTGVIELPSEQPVAQPIAPPPERK